ncbi:hypothetical protein C0995_008575 [Termitomyces sp. Mi166|nr:hypothetical protein C0995_008575 [Termitomyces sp. Mi166\
MLCPQTNPQMPFDNLGTNYSSLLILSPCSDALSIASQGHPYHYQYAPHALRSFNGVGPAVISAQNPGNFETTVYNYSESSSPSSSLPPSPPYQTPSHLSSPSPQKSAPRLRSGNRIPRPRNAFMIFRSEFWAGAKISKSVEHDHRHISRIIGHCWNQLTEEGKAVWRRRAEQEKIEHQIKYPGYRFSPNVRTKQVIKRNVKRNGEDEMLRCKKVAELLLAGKAGKELDNAVKSIDISLGRDSPLSKSKKALDSNPNANEYPAFRSPLLPPEGPKNVVQAHQYSNEISRSTNKAGQNTPPYQMLTNNIRLIQSSNTPLIHEVWSLPLLLNLKDTTPLPTAPRLKVIADPTQTRFMRALTGFDNPFDYHGRNEPHTTHGHIASSLVEPASWISSRSGH